MRYGARSSSSCLLGTAASCSNGAFPIIRLTLEISYTLDFCHSLFFKRLAQQIKSCVVRVVREIEQRFKQWTKPNNESLVAGTLADVTRSKGELIAENALLRQQVIIVQPQTKRPQLTQRDRGLLVMLAR
jgi:hypothetical protein